MLRAACGMIMKSVPKSCSSHSQGAVLDLQIATLRALPAFRQLGSPARPLQRSFTTCSFVPSAIPRDTYAQAAATEEYQAEGTTAFEEVEWNAQLENAISLVGSLGRPLEIRQASGYQVANGSLAVRTGKDKAGNPKPPAWFDLEIWGNLAVSAAQELRKGERIQVLGKLKANEWTNKEGSRQKAIKVSVDTIHRIRPGTPQPMWEETAPDQAAPDQSHPEGPGYDDQTAGLPGWGSDTPPNNQYRGGKNAAQWDHLLKHLNEYYDNRTTKMNPKAPDFKHKQSKEALWLDSAPRWAQDELQRLTQQS